MKIGIDASRANKQVKTGVEWYAYNLIRHFCYLDKDNQYFLYTKNKLASDLSCSTRNNFHERILSWPLPYLWTQLRLPAAILADRIDLLFLPASGTPVAKLAPTAVTIHDLGFKRLPQLYSRQAIIYHNFSHWQIAKQADLIITVSNFTKNDIVNFLRIPEEKVEVVPLAVDHNIFFPHESTKDKLQLQERYGIDYDFFLYVGRLDKKKNITAMMRAWREFVKNNSQLRLLIVGPTGGHESDVIFREIERSPGVVYFPYLPINDLPLFYSQAVAFLFPSLFEGFGLPVLEAMACGCPVICSNRASLPEVGGEAVWYFDPDQPDQLAVLMQNILHDDKRQQLSVLGRQRASQFTWKKTTQLTLSAFAKIRYT